ESYGEIFDYVDFGEEANHFLILVGAKLEPSSVELARLVVNDPAKVLGALDFKRYIDLLKKLAGEVQTLKADKELWRSMKMKKFLLAEKFILRSKPNGKLIDHEDGSDFDDDDRLEKEYVLESAGRIVINDSVRDYDHFLEHLCCPPPDDVLEAFYE